MDRNRSRQPSQKTAASVDFGLLQAIGRQFVYPGETLTRHKVVCNFESSYDVKKLSGCYVDIMSFYVPIRLIDDGFTDWVTMQEGATPPSGASALDKRSLTKTGDVLWFQDALEFVRQYFFELDGVASPLGYLPQPDTSLRMLTGQEQVDVTVPVDVVNENFKLSSLAAARHEQLTTEWLNALSNSYTGMLQGMGVQIDQLGLGPEYLGGTRRWITPQQAIDDDTGVTVQNYKGEITWKRSGRRAYFHEHGVVLDVAVFRPKVFDVSAFPIFPQQADMLILNMSEDMQPFKDWRWMCEVGMTSTDAGKGASTVFAYEPTTEEDRVYPNYSAIIDPVGDPKDRVWLDGKVSSSIKTWLPKPNVSQLGLGASVVPMPTS